jgi:hypothetical protein
MVQIPIVHLPKSLYNAAQIALFYTAEVDSRPEIMILSFFLKHTYSEKELKFTLKLASGFLQ